MSPIKHVLLISTDLDQLEHLESVMAASTAQLASARADSVEAGLDLMKRQQVDVALLDLGSIELPAPAAIALLRAAAPALPVVVLAEPTHELDALKAVQAGAQDYLLKGQLFDTLVVRTLRYASERQATAARLATRERYMRALIENSLDMILVLEGRRIRYASPSAEATVGCRAESLLGLDVTQLVHPGDRARVREAFASAGALEALEVRVHHASGEWRVLEVNARNLLDDPAVGGMVVSCRDVTERIRMEEALRGSERYYRALIENASDLIAIFDANANVRYVAPSSRRLLGFRPQDLVGHPLDDFLHADDAEVLGALIAAVLDPAGHRKTTAELRFRHYDGSWRTFEVTLENRLDDPVVAGIVANARDATERKAAEEALGVSQEQLRHVQRLEAIGRLAGGVAHDFNNLLTAMSGHIYLLSADIAENDPRRLHVEEIKRSAGRAAALTRQLLAFGRKQVLRPRVLDLNAVVADVDRMLRRVIGEHIELVTKLAPDLGRVQADLSQVEQVLTNLVVNARDAMPAGGRILLETENAFIGPDHPRRYHYVRPGPYVLLSVTDTGVGMDESVRSRVFEPFFTTKELGKGSGLGLATVYGIVKQSEGFIWVDSAPGQGSRFEVYLPRAEEAEQPGPDREPEVLTMETGGETVLLVEDEDAVRSLACRVLRRSGYNVLVARDGTEAIELAGRFDGVIHLVVSDLVMPQVGGREVAEHLLRRTPAPRVLLISGYAPDALPAPPAGVSYDYLQKPFTPDVLTRKVRDVLDGRAA